MKSIINYITESNDDWSIVDQYSYSKSAKYFWINTEGYNYGFMTEDNIKSFASDFDDEDIVDDILKLNTGECYDADGGINIYFKIA